MHSFSGRRFSKWPFCSGKYHGWPLLSRAWELRSTRTRRLVTSELWRSHTYECRAELTGFMRCRTPKRLQIKADTHLTLAATEEIASFLRFFLLDTAVPMLAWKQRLQENSTFQMSKHWRKRVKRWWNGVVLGCGSFRVHMKVCL